MIIISSGKLEHSLAADDLSPWDKTKYIILPAILLSLMSLSYVCGPTYCAERRPMLNALVSFLCLIASAFVTYFGIKKCHRTNESLDNTAFFERFFILSVPVLVQLMLVCFPVSLAALHYAYLLRDSHPLLHKRFPMLLSLSGPVITWLYYVMVDRSLKRLGRLIQEKYQ